MTLTPTSEPTAGTLIQQVTEPIDASAYGSVARLSMPDTASMAFDGVAPSGHTVRMGNDPGVEGIVPGPSPMEMVLLAVGGCTGLDVISILRKKRQVVTDYRVNVYANRAAEHPKVYTEMVVEHVVEGVDVDPRAVERAVELSVNKYCSVEAMLFASVRIGHVFRIVEAGR